MAHGNNMRKMLLAAEEQGYISIDSEANNRTHIILDKDRREAAIIRERRTGRQQVVIPFAVLKELAEIAEVWC